MIRVIMRWNPGLCTDTLEFALHLNIFCICFDGVVIAAQRTATFLKINCAPSNLGIRTWMCRLNFAQRPIISGLRFFNEPEISDSGPLEGLVLRIYTSWQNPSTSVGFEPANLGSRGKHFTPRPPRQTISQVGNRTMKAVISHRLKRGPLPPNDVGMVTQHIMEEKKEEIRKGAIRAENKRAIY